MRPTDVIIRETHEQNHGTFNMKDRANARVALGIYMFEINRSGLRCEFDYCPDGVDELLELPHRHRGEVDRLKARVKRFEEFIKLIEKLGDRSAVQLNPMWDSEDDAAETITRTLDPQAILTYRAFHTALVTYVGELAKKNPDWSKAADLARQVAYTVNGDEWRKTGVATPGRGVADFGTQWFLEAILAETKESTD
jgi:hypothetical protein